MDNVQFFMFLFTLLGALFTLFVFIHKEVKSVENKMEDTLTNQQAQISIDRLRSDKAFAEQSKRSDHLYEMFIDLLKEKK